MKYLNALELKDYVTKIIRDRENCGGEPSIDLYTILGHIVCLIEEKESLIDEELEKAATEWNKKASFQPFYMELDGNGNPNGVEQDIITHKESFKAGAEWYKQRTNYLK